jgi:hypothetical protein
MWETYSHRASERVDVKSRLHDGEEKTRTHKNFVFISEKFLQQAKEEVMEEEAKDKEYNSCNSCLLIFILMLFSFLSHTNKSTKKINVNL